MAQAVERSGIVATYELHDRVLSNRNSRRRYADEPPRLGDVQRRILEALDSEGFVTVPFAQLVDDLSLRSAVDGSYGFWLQRGRYDIIVSRDGWIPQVVRVQVDGGFVLIQDFTLQPFQPCAPRGSNV